MQDIAQDSPAAEVPSYHDLHITTADIPRRSIFDLPFNLILTCARSAGWELWRIKDDGSKSVIAGEFSFPGKWLVLDVAGHVIVDSRETSEPEPEEPQAVS